jgi:hypothetical protein
MTPPASEFSRREVLKLLVGVGAACSLSPPGVSLAATADASQTKILPARHQVSEEFSLPQHIPPGEYVLALAILDPAGNLPCVKFAIANYINGGRHPIGKVGVGVPCPKAELDPAMFQDPQSDKSLRYLANPGASPAK